MNSLLLEILVVFILLLGNGAFSMAEIAVVSARKSRLRSLAEGGDARARRALGLAESPNTFLATVQVGITLVGVLAAAYGGASISERLAEVLDGVAWLAPYAEEVAFGVVVIVLTYFTLVLGELVPKRIGLGNPERVARLVAGPMHTLSIVVGPLVGLLGRSTDLLLALLRIKARPENDITDDDVRLLVREGMRAGVFHAEEPAMVESVMALDRRPVRDVMTPRARIIWINAQDSHDTIWHRVVVSSHTTFPVYEGRRDQALGFVNVKSIYANLAAGIPVRVRDLVTPALLVPESMSVAALLDRFRSSGKHVALATDPAGAIAGLVTLHDLMEAIVGRLPSLADRLKPRAERKADGSWLVDGHLELDQFAATVTDFVLPPPPRHYANVAGLVVALLGRVPAEGESFRCGPYLLEVIDLDGPRVDKILLLPAPPPAGPDRLPPRE